ncbi:Serine acetyltransferase [Buchnera aphidicola (Eriosoma lanigerum)]
MFKTLDMLWSTIVNETQFLLKKESFLFRFYYKNILQHHNLTESIIFILSKKLSNPMISDNFLYKIFNQCYLSNPIMIEFASRDIQAIYNKDPAVNHYVIPLLYFKGFHALQGYRISNYFWKKNKKSLALYLQNQISTLMAVDIHPAATIGSGIMFDHATGIVIGETVIIEDNVSILQSVTLGGTGKQTVVGNRRHPRIRSKVIIGAGAKVLGNIEVGYGAKIGAGAVVLNSVPEYSTVVGVPAKIVNQDRISMLLYKTDLHNTNKMRHSKIIENEFEYGSGI